VYHENRLCDDSMVNTIVVTKGIKSGAGERGNGASLVVVSGGILYPSEYEGQVSFPVGFAGQQPFIFGALPLAALSPQPFHSSHETDA